MTEPIKKLYRSLTDRMAGGVCAGLGDYLRVDPTVVRIVFVLSMLLSAGTSLLVYLALWLLIPEEPTLGTGKETAEAPIEVPSVPTAE